MKLYKKLNIIIGLLLVLFLMPISYAKDQDISESSDIKNGDPLLIIEDVEKEPMAPMTSEKKTQTKTPAKEKTENKDTNQSKEKEDIKPITYDPKAAEINDRINSKRRENEANKEVDGAIKELNKSTDDIKEVIKDDNIKEKDQEKNPSQEKNSTSEKENLIKTVQSVNDIVSSKKLSKEDSEKIVESTKSIIKDYNKQIKEAQTEEEKKNLENEASKKINESIKEASNNSNISNPSNEKDDISIYEQKNETLVLEIDSRDTPIETSLDKISKDKGKETALSKSPRLASENKRRPMLNIAIVFVILLVIISSIALALVLKKRERLKIKR